MAGFWVPVFKQSFTSTDSVVITHNLDRDHFYVTVLVDDVARLDLVENLIPTFANERNELTVTLSSTESGEVVLYDPDVIAATSVSMKSKYRQFQFAEDITETQTTSQTLQQKLRLTTSDLDPGLYRIEWSYRFFHAKSTQNFLGRVQLNDSINLALHAEAHGVQVPPGGGEGAGPQKQRASGVSYYSLSGVNTIDIDFASDSGDTATIAEAKIELAQVGFDTTYLPGSVPGTLT